MRKIPTVFVRDAADRRRVTRTVAPGCEWVFDDPAAVPTRKFDGTCVMLDAEGRWWARREVKPGKTPPPNFREIEIDAVTGKAVGWEPIEQSGFARWHEEARAAESHLLPGTYELIGPRINGNPEEQLSHVLVRHATAPRFEVPADFDSLAAWLRAHRFEGVVWHHPDGRMAKLKRRDFPAEGA